MSLLSDSIIEQILTAVTANHDPNGTIKLLKWHMENDAVKPGSHRSSDVTRLVIEYEKNRQKLRKAMFLKKPLNALTNQFMKKFRTSTKELTMYTEIFPKMYTFESEYFTPRNYYVGENESLFLKDLSQSGYKMINRVHQLDFQHSYYVIRCLAKFHALSIKLDESEQLSEDLKKERVLTIDNPSKNIKDLYIDGVKPFVDKLSPEIKAKYPKHIEILNNLTWDLFIQDIMPKPNSFNVLAHGDCSSVNLLFKYDKSGIVKKVKLVDFQAIKWTSPTIDLLHFGITSIKTTDYLKHFDLLLEIYLDNLNKMLKFLNCVRAPYEMKALKKDMADRYNFAFATVTSVLPHFLETPEDTWGLDDLITDDKLQCDQISKMYHNPHFIKACTEWFLDIAEKDFFNIEQKME